MQLVSQFCCDTSCALRYRLLESCYTRQRFSVILEAVVSSAAISSWNKTSRAQREQFDWPMPLNVATQVAGKVLHCATWEKFLATLRNALQKVELTSTFHNDCSDKKIATNVCSWVCYTRQYFVQLVSQQNCETSCKRMRLKEFLHAFGLPVLSFFGGYSRYNRSRRGKWRLNSSLKWHLSLICRKT